MINFIFSSYETPLFLCYSFHMKKIIPLLILIFIVFISSGQSAEQQSLETLLTKWLPNKPLESFLAIFEIPYWGILVSLEERGYYPFVEFLIRKGTHFVYFGIIATCRLCCFAKVYIPNVSRQEFLR